MAAPPATQKLRIAALFMVAAAALALLTVSADYDVVLITFKLGKEVGYGRGFVVAGNVTELGSWDVQAAPQMQYYGPDEYGYNWKVDVNLTGGAWIEFKPVEIYYDSKEVICWYPGSNIFYQVGTTASKGTVFLGVDTFPDCNGVATTTTTTTTIKQVVDRDH